ncbi:hypothetical protein DES52_10211 [Deinococcus yavapaiensis KR-236]|uniref:Uncharacterized protein n=1 Tax=Deinococcus yavapaiensis KR-236 TaxID=694435 RepID=A0A318SDN0_9DEIO|nr:hypothetical protein DES52_10211 [Deinococcus yavapaiensis KR-236]
MNTTFEGVHESAFPAAVGADQLAWSHLLDFIFADAYRQGVSRLRLRGLPTFLEPDVQLRAQLSGRGAGREALVLGASHEAPSQGVCRVYTITGGVLASPSLRWRPMLSNWRRLEVRSVLTWRALAWGIPIRMAYLASRPDLADRAHFAMRRDFAYAGLTPARYTLTVWEPA